VPKRGQSRHRMPEESWHRRAMRRRKELPLWQELPLLLILAFGLAFVIRAFLLQAFYIPSGSMENTLLIGDRVLVNKVVYDVRDPHRGEVVVFRGTDNWAPENQTPGPTTALGRLGGEFASLVGAGQPGERDFIKRVIGLPGDTVQCCDALGRVTVNGHGLDEPYVTDNSPLDEDATPNRCGPRKFGPIVVAPGNMWVMGDHRAVSQDSRCQGQVPIRNVIGKAFVVVWPHSQWSTLGTPPTFDHVPAPARALPAPGTVTPVRVPAGGWNIVLLAPFMACRPLWARSRLPARPRGRRLAP